MSAAEVRTGQRIERWLYRCSKCRTCVRREVEVSWERHTYYHLGRMSTEYRATYAPHGYTPNVPPYATCEKCGRSLGGRPVAGRLNESVRCNARCTGATGSDCECSCAGANHGSAHRSI